MRYTDFEPPVEQLFHLAQDPLEERDLANAPEYVGQLTKLRERCQRFRDELQ